MYHFRDKLQWCWEEQFQSEYGALRDEALEAFDKFLDCGVLAHGCARAVCENCSHSELIAFSCKRRSLCSSCDAKRAIIFAEHLHESLLLPYPISHQVYTIPKRLRVYFKFNRKLHKHLYSAAYGAWSDLVEDELPELNPAAVLALHTAGDLLNFHPHVHALMLHGALYQHERFHQLDSIQTEYLTRRFQERVLESLLEETLIDQETVSSMLSWQHSGFHVFVGKPIESKDSDARLFVARYLKKCPVSLKRLELIETDSEPVVRYHKVKDNLKEHRDFSPLEFLAVISQHIPDRWEQTTRYYGAFSARTRGAKKSAAVFVTLSELEPAPKPSKTWAACMKRIFEIDPLHCPKCSGSMKIKAFLVQPGEISRLCQHLGIAASRAPPPIQCKADRLAA